MRGRTFHEIKSGGYTRLAVAAFSYIYPRRKRSNNLFSTQLLGPDVDSKVDQPTQQPVASISPRNYNRRQGQYHPPRLHRQRL